MATPLEDIIMNPRAVSFEGVMAAASAARAAGFFDIADGFRYFANCESAVASLSYNAPAVDVALHLLCCAKDAAGKPGPEGIALKNRLLAQALFVNAYAIFTLPGERTYIHLEKVREAIGLAMELLSRRT